jgi:hypothetical protein
MMGTRDYTRAASKTTACIDYGEFTIHADGLHTASFNAFPAPSAGFWIQFGEAGRMEMISGMRQLLQRAQNMAAVAAAAADEFRGTGVLGLKYEAGLFGPIEKPERLLPVDLTPAAAFQHRSS